MKPSLIVCIIFLLICGTNFGQENYRGGIGYGPKAALNISGPEGWVLDNKSGVEQGQPCVLYPKGSLWSAATTIMYAKIGSKQAEDVNLFVAWAVKGMEEVHARRKE